MHPGGVTSFPVLRHHSGLHLSSARLFIPSDKQDVTPVMSVNLQHTGNRQSSRHLVQMLRVGGVSLRPPGVWMSCLGLGLLAVLLLFHPDLLGVARPSRHTSRAVCVCVFSCPGPPPARWDQKRADRKAMFTKLRPQESMTGPSKTSVVHAGGQKVVQSDKCYLQHRLASNGRGRGQYATTELFLLPPTVIKD